MIFLGLVVGLDKQCMLARNVQACFFAMTSELMFIL